jgi:hypothetical protein
MTPCVRAFASRRENIALPGEGRNSLAGNTRRRSSDAGRACINERWRNVQGARAAVGGRVGAGASLAAQHSRALPGSRGAWAAQSLKTWAVPASAGKKHSMRSSCTVTSCGVPSVAIVVNKRSAVWPFRKCIASTGDGSSSNAGTCDKAGTVWWKISAVSTPLKLLRVSVY